MIKDGFGTFGANAEHYKQYRQGFPGEVFEWLKELAETRKTVLDLGCGTGIATKQLAELGYQVVGADIDERMIKESKSNFTDNQTNFIVAPADSLPFTDNRFEIVTAFSAFHWFCDQDSINEIKRILKKTGLFFVINKNDQSRMRGIIRNLIRKVTGQDLPSKPYSYKPKDILKEAGFNKIQEKIFNITEEYSLDKATGYAQTISIWNLVPEEKKGRVLAEIKEKLGHKFGNRIPREIEIKAVVGFK